MQALILGCGDTVRHVAAVMAADNHAVVVLDEHDHCESLHNPYHDVSLLPATGALMDDMRRGRVDRADCFLALSSDDNLNALAAQIASRIFNVPRTLCHVADVEKAEVYRELGLSVTSATLALAQEVMRTARDGP